jgi:hypothetical protein
VRIVEIGQYSFDCNARTNLFIHLKFETMKKANKKIVAKTIETVVVTNNDDETKVEVETISNDELQTVIETKAKKRQEKNGKCKQIIEFLSDLIEAGQFTQKQLAKIAYESLENQCELTITTLLVDAKNPKYNKFPKLVVKTAENTLKFA